MADDDDRSAAAPEPTWRERLDAQQPVGVVLDPSREAVPGVRAYPTAYVPGHLIIDGHGDRAAAIAALRRAGEEFGWAVDDETFGRASIEPGSPSEAETETSPEIPAEEPSTRVRASAPLSRAEIRPSPRPDRDDEPVPPVDAWRLLQRARRRLLEQRESERRAKVRGEAEDAVGGTTGEAPPPTEGAALAPDSAAPDGAAPDSAAPDSAAPGPGDKHTPPVIAKDEPLALVSLDHVISVDIDMNPFGRTGINPFGRTGINPFGRTGVHGNESYAYAGSGGHQVVSFVGDEPHRTPDSEVKTDAGGRRPVVAFFDTGCGVHDWLPGSIVTTYPVVNGQIIGLRDKATDPEEHGNLAGPFDGFLDEGAGHGTFVAGIIRQACPDADLVSVRIADSQGVVIESNLIAALEDLADLIATTATTPKPFRVDVLNLSLGYYHETPEDGLFSTRLYDALVVLRKLGCAIVCSAGNDSTDRPAFPAALSNWAGSDFTLDEPVGAAPHLAVGALNPARTSVALFSNVGEWVHLYAPGASVVSTSPPLAGGVQAGSRDDRYGRRRESIDPDDFVGGFAVWSGTSFAAPYVAGRLANAIAADLMAGTADSDSAALLDLAESEVRNELEKIDRSKLKP